MEAITPAPAQLLQEKETMSLKLTCAKKEKMLSRLQLFPTHPDILWREPPSAERNWENILRKVFLKGHINDFVQILFLLYTMLTL